MKVVIDTNVVASAIFFGGKPQNLIQLAICKKIETFVSKEIVEEYKEILERLSKKYPTKAPKISLESIIPSFDFVEPSRKIEICRDPDDNKFLECATESKCLYIVSDDNDLLTLKKFEDVEIITVAQFFERYSE